METKWTDTKRPIAVSLCTPAVRMLVLEAWAWRENGEWKTAHQIHPVVALRASISRTYTRSYTGRAPADVGTEKELAEAGWCLDTQEEETAALIVQDGELVGIQCAGSPWQDGIMRTICAPWPPAADEERLAEELADLEEMAMERAQTKAETAAPGEARPG